MAVLVEGISVVIQCEKIIRVYRGGGAAFSAETPNSSLRADGHLACLTFMKSDDVHQYVKLLEQRGLIYTRSGKAADLVVVDQKTGFCVPCDWAFFGVTNWNNDPSKPVSVCSIGVDNAEKVVVPNGWVFEKSLSSNALFIKNKIPDNLIYISREKGVDIYQDCVTGEKYYVSVSDRNLIYPSDIIIQ